MRKPNSGGDFELNARAANGHHWYAHYLIAARRTAEAGRESRRALELDPLSLVMNTHLGWHLIYAPHYDQALDQLRTAMGSRSQLWPGTLVHRLAYEQKEPITKS